MSHPARTTLVQARRITLALVLAAPLSAQQTESIDRAALAKIREEGMQRSQVMQVASYLTDVHGARLTNSPQQRAAANWAVGQLKGWGINSARLETWGPFGRGWSNEKFSARVMAPTSYTLLAHPAAWSHGTNGVVRGEVALVQIDSVADIAKYRGTLRGKWVMLADPDVVPAKFDALGRRWTDAQLDSIAALPAVTQQGGPRGGGGGNAGRFRAMQELNRARTEFLQSEGIAGILNRGSGRNDYGSFVVSSGGSRAADAEPAPPVIVVAAEHYGRIARTLEKGVPVSVEIEADNRFHDAPLTADNIIAELPGTDRRDEVVMLGAHFDSWHSGTGATDNAAGSAVMLEAMRILKASGLPLRRTVRLALWTGEEQGLLGSRAYVREHFGYRDSTGLHTKPAYEKFSAYYNMDNGTGAMRGVYAQGNAAVRPVFEQWMQPLRDLGMRVTTIRSTGSTDHVPFDQIGLPGFQFIQDPVEYGTRTHHSNQDLYDRLQEDDLKKNAVIVATFVYLTANRPELLPRKPMNITP